MNGPFTAALVSELIVVMAIIIGATVLVQLGSAVLP